MVERVDEAQREAIETHLQLGRTALEANNSQEALEHFNKALEADPNNEDAWVGKAWATHGLSTAAHDRLDEALRYIERALELDSESISAKEAREEIKRKHSMWLNHLGEEEWKLAVKIANIWVEYPDRQRQEAAPHVRKALSYYVRALTAHPESIRTLENIAWVLSHKPGGREYGDPTPSVKAARFLKERESIRAELVALREELDELESQKQRGGFGLLDRRRVQYFRVKKRIAELESLVEAATAVGIDTKV